MRGVVRAALTAVVVVAVSVAVATGARPCCMPKRWTGRYHETVRARTNDKEGTVWTQSNITYDYLRRRVAIQELITGHEVSLRYHVIGDYLTNLGYFIDIRRSRCVTVTLDMAMTSPCIQRNATFIGRMTYGYGKMKLTVNSWKMNIRNRLLDVDTTISVNDACVPVTEVATGVVMATSFMTSINFYDVVMGIKDASVFKVPTFCKRNKPIRGEKLGTVNYMFNKFRR